MPRRDKQIVNQHRKNKQTEQRQTIIKVKKKQRKNTEN